MKSGEFEHPECNFRYPENWELKQTDETGQLEVTVESPEGGFWTLQNFGAADVHDVVDQACEAMRAEYDQLEASEVEDRRFETPMVGYDLDFYCLDLVIESHLRAVHANGNTYLIMYQAEDRDFQSIAPVFAAITKTLLDSFDEIDEAPPGLQ